MAPKRAAMLCFCPRLSAVADQMEKEPCRPTSAFSLMDSYHLLDKLWCIIPPVASKKDLSVFHKTDYINFIETFSLNSLKCVLSEEDKYLLNEYGLNYDCPLKPGLYGYLQRVVGGSVFCAEALQKGSIRVAINFYGGWHHAQPEKAAGYCYFNDCVLGVLKLLETFPRVLYIDLDAHHGDAVQDAFYTSKRVFTLSMHLQEVGFYPGTGSLDEKGISKGTNYSCNVPFKKGLSNEQWTLVIDRLFPAVRAFFKPSAVVVQCGVDGLSGDCTKAFNLTSTAYKHALSELLSWGLPVLVLGGGGYNKVNVAKCWTELLAKICDIELSNDIPDHPLFPWYGPSFELEIDEGAIPNENSQSYLNEILAVILSRINSLS